jgi:pyridoxamine 5'-phosphate oxidase-like protein
MDRAYNLYGAERLSENDTERNGAMGRVYDDISEEQEFWIGEQPVFFVATAAPDAHVNLSPRGLDTFRVLGPNRVAWLDLTGSGVETIAHLRADGRITLMFCAFEGLPKILRLYGRGEVREPGDVGYDELRPRFPDLPGERAIIDVSVERIADSCGFGVPLMAYEGERPQSLAWAETKLAKGGPRALEDYVAEKNAVSIDGLPALG